METGRAEDIAKVEISGGIDWQLSSGEIVHADSLKEAHELCPVLGKMSLEEASVLFDLASIGHARMAESQATEPATYVKERSKTNDEKPAAAHKRHADKKTDKSDAAEIESQNTDLNESPHVSPELTKLTNRSWNEAIIDEISMVPLSTESSVRLDKPKPKSPEVLKPEPTWRPERAQPDQQKKPLLILLEEAHEIGEIIDTAPVEVIEPIIHRPETYAAKRITVRQSSPEPLLEVTVMEADKPKAAARIEPIKVKPMEKLIETPTDSTPQTTIVPENLFEAQPIRQNEREAEIDTATRDIVTEAEPEPSQAKIIDIEPLLQPAQLTTGAKQASTPRSAEVRSEVPAEVSAEALAVYESLLEIRETTNELVEETDEKPVTGAEESGEIILEANPGQDDLTHPADMMEATLNEERLVRVYDEPLLDEESEPRQTPEDAQVLPTDPGKPKISTEAAENILLDTPINHFEETVRKSSERTETISPNQILLPRDDQPAEEVLIHLAIYFKQSNNKEFKDAELSKIEPMENIRQVLLDVKTEPDTYEDLVLTPELTQKVLDMLTAIGFKNPDKALLEIARNQGVEYLLDALQYLSVLTQKAERKEFNQVTRLPIVQYAGTVIGRLGKFIIGSLSGAFEPSLLRPNNGVYWDDEIYLIR